MFLAFCFMYQIDMYNYSVNHAISFIEFLAYNGLATPTIATYVSAIKAKCLQFNLTTVPWSHPRIPLMLKSCSRTIEHVTQPKQVLSPHTLTLLIAKLNSHPMGSMYKGLFLLAFHGFFRISNLLPKTQSSFQASRHLSRGDVSITSPGITVFLKWSKTLQANKDTRLIPLAAIPGSPLCPLQAILQINQLYPVSYHCPMFSHMVQGKLVVISQSQARRVLSELLASMGLNPKCYGFHTFRRSGASLAFSLNVPVQYIKAHGTWASDAVWAYLDNSLYPTVLTTTLSNHLATHS